VSRLEELRAEARYARERLALYRARLYGQRRTSMSRLRELERAADGAQTRLRDAERDEPQSAAEAGRGN
jgi:hypothetical protein